MIPTVQLPGTELRTTGLGFGCAGLYRLPSRRERERLLATAFDGGIRHFDTAPMYGLGLSEQELGRFAASRRDQVVIVTKFGIAPTAIARAVGRVQGPARRLLRAAPRLQRRARLSGATPSSGRAGSLLYETHGYTPESARRSLEASLRALATDHVDVLLLHDPAPGSVRGDDLCAFLDAAVGAGTVRAWGVAGERAPAFAVADAMPAAPRVLQIRDDILTRAGSTADRPVSIAFGVLSGVLPALVAHLRSDPAARRRWSDQVQADCADPDAAVALLLRESLAAAPGVVLFSTTSQRHLDVALRAAERGDAAGDPAIAAFRTLVTTELLTVLQSRR